MKWTWTPPVYDRKHVDATLSVARSESLVRDLEALGPAKLPDAVDRGGRDGITVEGATCNAEGQRHEFSAWSPTEKNPAHRAYFLSLLRAALEVVPDEDAAFALENLLGYLSDELLVRDLGGSPRVIRLFGGYSIEHKKPLAAFFAGVPPGDVIVDARNFDGAGLDLKPEFVAFDRRKGRTVWVSSPWGAKDLASSFGVRPSNFAATLEEARRRLSLPDAGD